jgi:F-box protein 9
MPDTLQTQSAIKTLPASLSELVSTFSSLSIQPTDPPTELSPPPPCPISQIPEEILAQILTEVAITDPASFGRLTSVCKRLAFLVLTEDPIWRRLIHGTDHGLGGMHYEFATSVTWASLPFSFTLGPSPPQVDNRLLLTPKYPSYLTMFRSRPRIRFGGCYISCVNYTRHGSLAGGHSLSWNTSPVLIVTYYRYLRFFRDGTVISLLTTAEPADVVGVLKKENMKGESATTSRQSHSQASVPEPQPKVMREALRGRWRMTGDPFGIYQSENEEDEGEIIIETEGVNEKYIFKMQLGIASAGRGTRNNKLAWRGFWSYNKLTDDWAEFLLRNDRPYFWSRVKSYGTGA